MRLPHKTTSILVLAVLVVLGGAVTWKLRSPRTSQLSESILASPVEAGPPAAVAVNDPVAVPKVSSSQRGGDGQRDRVREIVDTLIARADAHSLVTAALLIRSNAPHFMEVGGGEFVRRAGELARQAARDAPGDAAVQAIALLISEDPAPFASALSAIDSSNAWSAATELKSARDEDTRPAILARMSRASRFESHRPAIELLLANSIREVADLSQPDTQQWLTLAMATLPLGVPQELAKSCMGTRPAEVLQDCRAVAKLMRDSGDDAIVREGLDLARALVKEGTPEAAQLAEAQRRYDWEMYHALRLPRSPEQKARSLKGLLPDRQLRRELMVENGVSPDPPPDWVSPYAPPQ